MPNQVQTKLEGGIRISETHIFYHVFYVERLYEVARVYTCTVQM